MGFFAFFGVIFFACFPRFATWSYFFLLLKDFSSVVAVLIAAVVRVWVGLSSADLIGRTGRKANTARNGAATQHQDTRRGARQKCGDQKKRKKKMKKKRRVVSNRADELSCGPKTAVVSVTAVAPES